MKRFSWMLSGILGLALVFSACGDDHDHHGHGHEGHDHAEHGKHDDHAHEAPHGGTLVVFGNEFAHIELVLAPATGELTVYVLDSSAKGAVRIKQADLQLTVAGETITLKAQASELSGETIGDSSVFKGQADILKGLNKFETTLKSIGIKGQTFDNVTFKFPEGNE